MNKYLGKCCRMCKTVLTKENSTSNTRLCKPCYNAKMREYFQKYKDKHRKIMYEWRKANKNKVRQMVVNYANKRFGSLNKQATHYGNIYKEQLTDSYIKFTLCRHTNGTIAFKEIPQDLVELKRKELLLKRQLKLGEASEQASVGTLLPGPWYQDTDQP